MIVFKKKRCKIWRFFFFFFFFFCIWFKKAFKNINVIALKFYFYDDLTIARRKFVSVIYNMTVEKIN